MLVLIGTYLFSAFNGRHLTTEVQIGLFAVVLLLAMHSSPLSGRSIAVMEALTGQVFLATLVARLVSAYRSPSPRLRPGPRGRDRLPEYVDGPGDDEDRD